MQHKVSKSKPAELKGCGGISGIILKITDGKQTIQCCNILQNALQSNRMRDRWQTMAINISMAKSHL